MSIWRIFVQVRCHWNCKAPLKFFYEQSEAQSDPLPYRRVLERIYSLLMSEMFYFHFLRDYFQSLVRFSPKPLVLPSLWSLRHSVWGLMNWTLVPDVSRFLGSKGTSQYQWFPLVGDMVGGELKVTWPLAWLCFEEASIAGWMWTCCYRFCHTKREVRTKRSLWTVVKR